MIIQPALKSLTSKGEHSALPNMTFTVLIGITHWNLVALHKTIDYLFPTPKATVKIGEYSRGGLTRGDNQASDHDMGCKEKYVPCGIVDEDNAELTITFGSSYKTSSNSR